MLNHYSQLTNKKAQKLTIENYCKLYSEIHGLDTISLRYFNIYGERQKITGAYAPVIGMFISQILNNQPMTIRGDGEQRRDFIYVGDVVSANILSMSPKKVGFGQVMNIGTGKNYSVNEIAEWMGGETTNIEPRIEPRETLLDSGKMKSIFDWKPTIDLKDWLKDENNV